MPRHESARRAPARIGERLLDARRISEWQLRRALFQQRDGERIGEALVRLGFVAEAELLAELARQHGVAYVEIGGQQVDPAVVRKLPEKLIRARRVFPIVHARVGGRPLIVVATSEPQNLAMLDEVAFASGARVQPMLASERDIERAVERHLGPAASPAAVGR
jgi:type IV pilus assembly protein PilB